MAADVLSDVLRSLKARGTVYFCDLLTPPWSKNFSDLTTASFHQVRRGGCWVLSEEHTEYLGPNDLVFLGPGRDHVLTSRPPDQDPSDHDPDTLLLCGYCEFTDDVDAPLRQLFPSMSILRNEEIQQRPWLKATLDQLSAEYLSKQPGAELVVSKLTEVLVVELIRANFGKHEQSRFLLALRDKWISKSLAFLHAHPEKGWTLESLANEIGMSRAGLAKRFKNLVGFPMFDYLTQLRMQRAKELLHDTALPMYEVASRVGYDSDISFTKTFKKRTGTTPTRFRKQARNDAVSDRS